MGVVILPLLFTSGSRGEVLRMHGLHLDPCFGCGIVISVTCGNFLLLTPPPPIPPPTYVSHAPFTCVLHIGVTIFEACVTLKDTPGTKGTNMTPDKTYMDTDN
ncbi:hypothetical protein E2C01_053266 [Portunus trituberculatus]|uniref:Uncharacterized protein n=1 Tax=Portunus trituberculatus TaxID=210409 RepID=A0A5B7GGM2_PORTR|nr:hypothetical protein [Portunus trituberculatus]